MPLSQYPLSLSFDTFTPPYQDRNEQYANFSPSLYSPLDPDGFGTDFTTDSELSPGSPVSPTLTALYALPQGDDWMTWDKTDQNVFKTEHFGDVVLSSSVPNMPLSPAINPMALTNTQVDDVLFGGEGISDNQPLFQTQFPLATPRAQPTSRTTQQQQEQQQQQQPQQQTQNAAEINVTRKPGQPTKLINKRYLRNNTLKRKSTSSAEGDDNERLSQRSSASPPPSRRTPKAISDLTSATAEMHASSGPKKTAHNMIEKRYRNNLNDKIAALRDAVPALRVVVHRLEGGDGDGVGVSGEEGDEMAEEGGAGSVMKVEGAEDLGGLTPAHKLNKATILGKATEYILHLERSNLRLATENAALRTRVEGFEMLVMSRGGREGVWA